MFKKNNFALITPEETIEQLIQQVRTNHKSLKKIQFNKHKKEDFTSEAITQLAAALQNNTQIFELDFSNTELEDSDVKALLDSTNLSVTTLKFNQLQSQLTPFSATAIAHSLARTNITTLEIDQNLLTSEVISILALGIKHNPTIMHFSCKNSHLTYTDFRPFRDSFDKPHKVTIDLKNNNFSDHDGGNLCLFLFQTPFIDMKLEGNINITNKKILAKLNYVLTKNNRFRDGVVLGGDIDTMKDKTRNKKKVDQLDAKLKSYVGKSNNQTNSKNTQASSSNQKTEPNLAKLEEELFAITEKRRLYFSNILDQVSVNDECVTELKFEKSSKLTPKRILDIADALERAAEISIRSQEPTHIQLIDLSHMKIGESGKSTDIKESLRVLMQAIGKYNSVVQSKINSKFTSNNNSSDADETIEEDFANKLKQHRLIRVIILDNNALSYELLKPMLDYMEHLFKINTELPLSFDISLKGNNLDDSGAKELSRLARENTGFTGYVENNIIKNKAKQELKANLLKNRQNLFEDRDELEWNQQCEQLENSSKTGKVYENSSTYSKFPQLQSSSSSLADKIIARSGTDDLIEFDLSSSSDKLRFPFSDSNNNNNNTPPSQQTSNIELGKK